VTAGWGIVGGMGATGGRAADPLAVAEAQWRARGWPDADAMVAARAITRAHRVVLARVDAALAPLGLVFGSCEALVRLELADGTPLPMGQLAELLEVSPTAVTRLVDRLEAAQLAARVPATGDRRSTLVRSTPAGRRRLREAMDRLAGVAYGIAELEPPARTTLVRALALLGRDDGRRRATRPDPLTATRERWAARGWRDPEAGACATLVTRAHRVAHARISAALAPRNLTFAQCEALVLLELARDHELPVGRLAALLEVNPSTATRVVDHLERTRLVDRVPSGGDGRTVLARLRAKGTRAVDDAVARMAAIRFGVAELGMTEQRRVARALGPLLAATAAPAARAARVEPAPDAGRLRSRR